MRVIIDVMGGDRPEESVKGALRAAKEFNDVKVVAVGDKKLIKGIVAEENASALGMDAIFTSEVISNDETPTVAIKQKKDSSMVRALTMLKEDPDNIGMISTGSTGAVLTGATLHIGRLPGIYRPTLLTQAPAMNGQPVCVTDGGANVDSRPEWLYQFAVIGSAYMKAAAGKENPSVVLLSVGTEEHKGNELTRAAYLLLRDSNLNFLGNIEARDALSGKYDVIVCDGYDGNVLIKSTEGAATMIMSLLKEFVMESTKAKLGYLFMKKALLKLKNRMDFNNYGGAPFLGIKKCVIKAHGASKAAAICNAVGQVLKIKKGNVIESISKAFADGVK